MNAHGGFTPAVSAPPNAITPVKAIQLLKRYYISIALSAGAAGGTGTVPSFIGQNLYFMV